tara:strand:- start:3791 stop:4732 length:942 start_codon:yes stop_codon:yes gene_type:complete
MDKIIVDTNPEFGYELACAAPYAYWLHKNNMLEKIITCKGMSPFYYFCNNVEERHEHRSMDNRTNGVQNLPNPWIHHNAQAVYGQKYSELSEQQQIEANGVLDYSKWIAPPYKEKYYDAEIDLPKKFIVLSNQYNLEHNEQPIGYFDIESMYNIFTQLNDKGYTVVYKRPKNTEFVTDANEWKSQNITANVEGHGIMTDYDLVSHFDNVILFDDLIKKVGGTYNEAQFKIFARSEGFIARGGGASILCSYFKVPVIIYINASGDSRPGYFDGDCYFKKVSGASIYPVIDLKDDIIKRGCRDYSKVYSNIEKVF